MFGAVAEVPEGVPDPPAHECRAIAVFKTHPTGKVIDGVPEREPCDPYYRAYCRCGWLGLRQDSETNAEVSWIEHYDDNHPDDQSDEPQT